MLTVDFDRLGCARATGSSTWGAAPDATPTRCTDAVPTSSPSTRTPTSCRACPTSSRACVRPARCPRGPRRHQAWRRAVAALRRRRVRPRRGLRGARAHPGRPRRDLRAGARARPGRHDGRDRAAVVARAHLLGAVRRVPRHEGGHIRIYRGDELVAKLEAAGLEHRRHLPRPRAARAVLVDQSAPSASRRTAHPLVRGYHQLLVWDNMRIRGVSRVTRTADRRAAARPADRQEPGALPPQARMSPLPVTVPALPDCSPRPTSPRPPAPSPRPSSPTARSRGAPGTRSTCGTTSRPPWGRWRAARSPRPRRRTTGARGRSAPTAPGRCAGSMGEVVDDSTETNMCAYLAVGVWHHWRIRRDLAFTERLWPVVRRGLDVVVGLQLPFGGVAWSREWQGASPGAPTRRHCSRAPRASTRRCAPASRSRPCSTTRSRSGSSPGAGTATPCASTATASSTSAASRWDWYYPVLGGAVRGQGVTTWSPPGGTTSCCRARDPLRRHQPVGHRRRDLRAGARPRLRRRPRPGATAARRRATPAQRRRRLLDRLRPGPTTPSGRASRRRTPRPRSCWPSTRSPARRRARDHARRGPRAALPGDRAGVRLLPARPVSRRLAR